MDLSPSVIQMLMEDCTNMFFQPLAGNFVGSLLFAIAHVLLFLAVGWYLDRKRIYLKV